MATSRELDDLKPLMSWLAKFHREMGHGNPKRDPHYREARAEALNMDADRLYRESKGQFGWPADEGTEAA